MAQDKKYTYQGLALDSEAELKEVKKEAESIEYIRANADLSDVKVALKIYNRLIEKGTLTTKLGVSFLSELRENIKKSGVVAENSLKPLPTAQKFSEPKEPAARTRDQKLLELYKDRNRNQRIVIFGLIAIIIVMFAIRILSQDSPLAYREKSLVNKYAAWSDELTQKEEELRLWESDLVEREKKLNNIQK